MPPPSPRAPGRASALSRRSLMAPKDATDAATWCQAPSQRSMPYQLSSTTRLLATVLAVPCARSSTPPSVAYNPIVPSQSWAPCSKIAEPTAGAWPGDARTHRPTVKPGYSKASPAMSSRSSVPSNAEPFPVLPGTQFRHRSQQRPACRRRRLLPTFQRPHPAPSGHEGLGRSRRPRPKPTGPAQAARRRRCPIRGRHPGALNRCVIPLHAPLQAR